jgi:diguanylate cyclase (GGDEF)-like protein/PAS domain S-box-containing protein
MTENQHKEINLLKKENEKLKEICKRYKLIIEGSNDGIWEWNIEKDIYTVSLRDREFFDYNLHDKELSISDWEKLVHHEDLEKSLNNLKDFISGKIPYYRNVYRMVDKNGKSRWILSKGKGIKNNCGVITHIAGSHTDITEKLEMEKELYELAYSDYLTKLSNREKMFRDFKEFVKNGVEEKQIAFFYIDIDEFGFINNTLGYEEGNRIIKKTARFLEQRYGEKGYIARISADEFLVMYIKDKNDNKIEKELSDLIGEIKKINFFEKHNLVLTVSIGAAVYKEHGEDFFELIRKADTALYCAKKNGKDQYHIYSPQMEARVYGNIELVNQIRIGIDKKEFEMYYQPVFEAKTTQLVGLEALIRWNHPFKGIVPPMDFIPIAEDSGQMVSLEKLIFEDVFSQVRKWIDKGENANFCGNKSFCQRIT